MKKVANFEAALDKNFRERLIALMLDTEWLARYGINLVKPEYFELDEEIAVVNVLLDFFVKYNRLPDQDELLILTETSDEADLVRHIYDGMEEWDLDFAEDQAYHFATQQALKIAILESAECIARGDLTRPRKLVTDAMNVGTSILDLGIRLHGDMDKWIAYNITEEKIPTGIHHVDMKLDGGGARGELGIVLAAPNVGKSMSLVQFGRGCASPLFRGNVLHITNELKDFKVAKRYGTRVTFEWLRQTTDLVEYSKLFKRQSAVIMPGEVVIVEYPSGTGTVGDIDNHINLLKGVGFEPDLVIVDYPDEMKVGRPDQLRFELATIYTELRGLAQMHNVMVWAASQTSRDALNKEIVTIKDFAEAYAKAAKADIVLAFCQTLEEMQEKKMRYFGAKVRDGEGGWFIPCDIHPSSHAIISTGILTMEDILGLETTPVERLAKRRNGTGSAKEVVTNRSNRARAS